MNNIQTSNEIDLIQLIETLWDSKWKIISIAAVCVVGVFGFQVLRPAPGFVAISEINPILASESDKYRQSNALGFFAVYRDIEERDEAELSVETRALLEANRDRDRDRALLEAHWGREITRDRKEIPSAVLEKLFIEQLGNRSLLASIFKKHRLLLREKFDSDQDYERALTQLAAKVSILPPVNEDGLLRGESRQKWTLKFKFNDQEKYLAAFSELKDAANKNVRNAVKSRFHNLVASAKHKRTFEIEDLDSEIAILMAAYDGETARKIAHLTEQVAIAKKLDITKPINIVQPLAYQSISTQGTESLGSTTSKVVTNIPLYASGYEALEKEIQLIESRRDIHLFIDGLLRLEQEKLVLVKDQTPERAEQLFEETPVVNLDDFQAARFDVAATNFQYNSKRMLMLALATVVGGVIGVVYVLIVSAMRSRREVDTG